MIVNRTSNSEDLHCTWTHIHIVTLGLAQCSGVRRVQENHMHTRGHPRCGTPAYAHSSRCFRTYACYIRATCPCATCVATLRARSCKASSSSRLVTSNAVLGCARAACQRDMQVRDNFCAVTSRYAPSRASRFNMCVRFYIEKCERPRKTSRHLCFYL